MTNHAYRPWREDPREDRRQHPRDKHRGVAPERDVVHTTGDHKAPAVYNFPGPHAPEGSGQPALTPATLESESFRGQDVMRQMEERFQWALRMLKALEQTEERLESFLGSDAQSRIAALTRRVAALETQVIGLRHAQSVSGQARAEGAGHTLPQASNLPYGQLLGRLRGDAA